MCHESDGKHDGAIEVLKDAVGRFEDHFLYPKLCYYLARNHWMRAVKAGHGEDRDAADIKKAKRWIGKALTDAKALPTTTFKEGGEEREQTGKAGDVVWVDAVEAHDHK